ncbi:MAG: hypothetical protein ACRCUT_03475, partial [Spirochaetota bacterium]
MSSRSKAAIISPRCSGLIEQPLRERGFDVLTIPACRSVDPRIADHPDLQICAFPGKIFASPGLPADFIAACSRYT